MPGRIDRNDLILDPIGFWAGIDRDLGLSPLCFEDFSSNYLYGKFCASSIKSTLYENLATIKTYFGLDGRRSSGTMKPCSRELYNFGDMSVRYSLVSLNIF